VIKVGVPSKGRLKEPSLRLLSRAGFAPILSGRRRLLAKTADPNVELLFLRAKDIPRLVEVGALDVGISGLDYVVESEAKVVELLDLKFGQASLVLAARKGSRIRSLEDVSNETVVATKYVNLTRKFFERAGLQPKIVEVSGSVELMPLLGIADAVVDVVSTGETLAANGLEAVCEVMKTSARLIANPSALKEKKDLIELFTLALESVLIAEEKVWLVMNVPEDALDDVVSVLPAMAGPTIAKVLSNPPMWEVNTVVPKARVDEIILEAKRRGARDILVLRLDRVVP